MSLGRAVRMMSYWGGRSRRKEYWLTLVAVLAAAVIMNVVLPNGPSSGVMTVLWSMAYVRRLHDLNRTGWWVAALFGLQLAVLGLALALGGQGALAALAGDAAAVDTPEGQVDLLVGMGGVVVALLMQAGFSLWLGVVRGDAGDNRFGPAPELARPKRRAAAA
ncbi:DUF805 domain-containing protein [Caulobacter sp. 17J65-9]|uniref:DUF805 domain-containing protein n=1 Tax=Caulobacter sp. 17J65-9 TaxID=2709382 RepID=UPI0013CA01D3|nr:DUF805 domain-containing protein [Caulobacter sp. 17J65-9]NEX91875.1 DUF805 domain-containing protein [Caulobacter sp. 17J65-9]